MSATLPFLPARDEVERRYRVETLVAPVLSEAGVAPAAGATIAWAEVARAFAAQVGEPQGVRTVVFDLVLAGADGPFQVRRFDAEPGDEAVAMAVELASRLPAERLSPALAALAGEGLVVEWHSDLCAFEEACLAALLAKGERARC